jgi:hypothetical protein
VTLLSRWNPLCPWQSLLPLWIALPRQVLVMWLIQLQPLLKLRKRRLSRSKLFGSISVGESIVKDQS